MILLALDTSTVACSVALQDGDRLQEEHLEREKVHTRELLPMVERVLEKGRTSVSDLDAVILGNGPGSFIGLRIAASVAQGICFGGAVSLVPVSSLLAVAGQAIAEEGAKQVLVAQDARMNEVYLAACTEDADGLPQLAAPLALQPLHEISELPQTGERTWLAAGDGWHRHSELLESNRDRIALVSEIRYPRAKFLLPLGAAMLAAGKTVDPAELVPEYLRQTVAKIPASRRI